MSDNFGHYSRYYDLLYADKDYAGEAAYIQALISAHSHTPAASLLELGCGTGIHALMLNTQAGLNVCGVDLSETMLERARARAATMGVTEVRVSFHKGDACNFRIDRKFDVVASLFHVVSYQTTELRLNAQFETAAMHLGNDGLFIFDFWYGPAVLSQGPSVRVRRLSDECIAVTRLAEPVIRDAENVVDVNYDLFVLDRATGVTTEVRETHEMRYLFLPEIDRLLGAHGFVRERAEEWMTGRHPSLDTWGVCVVARKK
jgi:SAM-dependent methyltransferase